MNQEELKELLSKYLAGAPLTEEEQEQLRVWDASFENAPRLTGQLSDMDKDRMRQRLWEHIDEATTVDVYPMRSAKRWLLKIAVAASLVISLSILWVVSNKKSTQDTMALQPIKTTDIVPGGDKAILTLADGTSILLDSARNGMLAQQGNATVLKLNDGQIAYNVGTNQPGELQYNTITTPIGGQFRIILPDGSKVMLNAGSSLRYPAQFTSPERRVSLTGEGYFEVQHNEQQPFIVAVNDMEVHDLGTEFNINAYSDEKVIQTTLVSGLAEVKKGEQTVKLHPGKAAQLKGGDIKLTGANVDVVTAWKNGLFQFDDANVETIMRQVARWYDVEVIYEKPATGTQITGKAFRNSTLQEMLKILELSDVHFRIEGKKIILTN